MIAIPKEHLTMCIFMRFFMKPLIMRDASLPFKFNKKFAEEHKKMKSAEVWSLEIFKGSDAKLSEEIRHLHEKI